MDDSNMDVDVFRMADPIGIIRSMPNNICEGCHAPIDERFFLAVDNQLWHAACLRCDACRGDLQWDQSCFIYKGRVLCRADYQSLSLCPGCDRRLSEDDLVFRLAERIVYHSECLRCHACGEVLHLGDTYALLGGRSVVCAKHATAAADVKAEPHIYEGLSYSDQQSGVMTAERGAPGTRKGKKSGKRSLKKTHCGVQLDRLKSLSSSHVRRHQQQLPEPSVFTEDNSSLDRPTENSKLSVPVEKSKKARGSRCRSSAINGTTRSKKRIRTSFKHDQLRAMKAHFELNQNPDSKDLRQLSDETGLTKRVLQRGESKDGDLRSICRICLPAS
ncbi:LIM/homeobox protein Lhx2 [Sparganum proliferum]